MSSLLRLYHALPSRLRSLAGSAQGYYLRSWRYGPETECLVAEALEREHWTSDKWRSWQSERLVSVLRRAATSVPYYRSYWQERRRRGDLASWLALSNWPILTKGPLRTDSKAFLVDDCRRERLFRITTGGTTGTPLELWKTRRALRAWYALLEARCRRWNGVTLKDRWANIGGQMVVPASQRRPPFWIWNEGLNQLYMSSYHIAPDLVSYYLDALEKYRVRYLLGNAQPLHSLAMEAIKQGRSLGMKVAITNAEPLYEHQRETIASAFQCPVQETYGMTETVAAASECSAGRMHIWPEVGFIEILDWQSDTPATPGETGRIVATGLLDVDMPLIRYEVGDSGAVDPSDAHCVCGKLLPRLLGLEGRLEDVLVTRDGRRVGRLDPVFKASLHISEAQIVQMSFHRVMVRLVPLDGYSQADEKSISARLRERMGEVEVVFEKLSSIPREKNGKFRAIVCRLSDEEKRRPLGPAG